MWDDRENKRLQQIEHWFLYLFCAILFFALWKIGDLAYALCDWLGGARR